MATAKHSIQVQVLAETRQAANALKGFAKDSGLDKIGAAAGKIGTIAAGAAAVGSAAIGAFVADGIGKAGDLEQSIGAVDTVFKGSARQMHAWAQGAAQSAGLTRDQYNQLATVLGTQLKNGGTAMSELGGKTNELVTLGADLASMFGGTTADAVGALSSALKGERDPIERYGVSLKQATIDAKAAELGFTKVGGSLSNEAQQAATLALIMEQTKDAHGNFAKEADTVQGKQARLSAQWTNLSARIGTAFLPALAAIGDWVATRVMPKLERLGTELETRVGPALATAGQWVSTTLLPALTSLGGWLSTNVLPALTSLGNIITGQVIPAATSIAQWAIGAQAWLVPLVGGILAMVAAWRTWVTIQAAWTAATKLAAAAQGILNAVMSANPIGLVIVAIAGLVAAIVLLWNKNEGFRRAVTAAWNTVAGAAGSLYRTLSGWFSAAGATISGWVNRARGAFNSTAAAVRSMGSAIGSAVSGVIQWFRDLPGRIVAALSGLGSTMAGIGRNMIESLAGALSPHRIMDKIGSVIGDAIGYAKRLLGIASPSRVFATIGAQTGAGLETGLLRSVGDVRRAAGTMAAAVVDAGTPGALDLPSVGAARRAGTGLIVNVHLQSLRPDAQTAQTIADAVETVWRQRGRRMALA